MLSYIDNALFSDTLSCYTILQPSGPILAQESLL